MDLGVKNKILHTCDYSVFHEFIIQTLITPIPHFPVKYTFEKVHFPIKFGIGHGNNRPTNVKEVA